MYTAPQDCCIGHCKVVLQSYSSFPFSPFTTSDNWYHLEAVQVGKVLQEQD